MGKDTGTRIPWVDVCRGMAILLVVVGHTSSPLGRYIYIFHIAAFFFLSGYAATLDRGTVWDFVRRRARTLLLPFFAFNVTFILLRAGLHATAWEAVFFKDTFGVAQVAGGLRALVGNLTPAVDLAGATWFLSVLFFASVAARLILASVAGAGLGSWVALPITAALFLVAQRLPPTSRFSVDLALRALLYLMAGYFARRWRLLERVNPAYGITFSALVVYLFAAIDYQGVNWPTRSFGNPALNLTTAAAGIYLLYVAARGVSAVAPARKLFSLVGMRSLSVLGLHFLAFRVVFLVQARFDWAPWPQVRELVDVRPESHWLMLTIVSVVLCLAVDALLRRNRFTALAYTGSSGRHPAPGIGRAAIPSEGTADREAADGEGCVPPPAAFFSPGVLLPALAVLLAAVANWWVVSPRNAFLMDDYTFIAAGTFDTYGNLARILPVNRYLDRPVGFMFGKLMYDAFGMNYRAVHVVLLGVHLLNVLLVYRLSGRLLRLLDARTSAAAPFLAAVIFGTWPRSVMCVQWLAANMDLIGTLLSLVVLNLYADTRAGVRLRWPRLGLMALAFFLALRTKEMTVVVPLLIVLYELVRSVSLAGRWGSGLRAFRPSAEAVALCSIMAAYVAVIFTSAAKGSTAAPDSPYFYTLSPSVVLGNLLQYLRLFFDLGGAAFGPSPVTGVGAAAGGLLALVAAIAVYRAVRQARPALAGGVLAVAVALAPVLPLKNMRHMLYLYLPSVCIALLLAVFLDRATDLLARRPWRKRAAVSLAAGLIALLPFLPAPQGQRRWWASLSQRDLVSIADLRSILEPGETADIHVLDGAEGYTIFSPYGPGTVNRIVTGNHALKTYVDGRLIDRSQPYLLLRYDAGTGHVSLIEAQRQLP